ncbi:MAG: PD40 domain-containing protein, partial [Chloroflexi bacterium]|nr:PD40 domain-containing protein [Chloroflexota bacterium]
MNLIAYVGPDDNIYTIRPDGSNPELLTIPMSGETASLSGAGLFNSHTIYNWPTWSPDATKIAFTSYAENGDVAGSLWVVHIPGGLPEKIFQDPPELVGRFVAPRSPHYIYWAPDSETIAFLAATPESLVLYLIDDEGLQDPRPVAEGAPSYISWSPDGHRLLHHLQGGLSIVDTRGELSISTFAFQSVAFRAPSWAPDGKRIAYVARLNGVDSLLITNLDEGTPLRVAPINNLGVFMWSPVVNEIAFTQISASTNLGTPTYDGLVVFDADALETRLISSLEIAAFFWSPDGSKLAYVTLTERRNVLRWMILDVIILATGFVLRAWAGSLAVGVGTSEWLVACMFTLCLFMGFGKRRCELSMLGTNEAAGEHRPTLRRYTPQLLTHLITVSAGMAIVTFLLYTMDTS